MIIVLIDKRKTERNCRFLDVDLETSKKLKPIRSPNVFEDNPRLVLEKEVPQHQKPLSKDIVITDEMRERSEAFLQYHLLYMQAGKRPISTPQPTRMPETQSQAPEEVWRYDPKLRAEFNNNFASYQAYLRTEKAGKAKFCGGKS